MCVRACMHACVCVSVCGLLKVISELVVCIVFIVVIETPRFINEFFFDSVSCPFQDYFTHRDEPIDRRGETGVPRENHLTHPQAELVLSHIWPVRGSNLHQTQR